jgi:hypothetical protein
VVVLFGGMAGGLANDTWEWDGTDWTQRFPTDTPSARYDHAMTYDSNRGAAVLFGGNISGNLYSDETWEWDGTNWAKKSPATKPAGRYDHAMAYDSMRGVVVLFGGDISAGYNDETWEWDGTNWIDRAIKPLSARCGHAMAYDSMQGVVVLFGGGTSAGYNDETWEWDGANWVLKNPANKPSGRCDHAMAYDSTRGVVVLFGGRISASPWYNDETWEWDGTNWTQKSPVNKPSARVDHAMAYDSARGAVVLFGGCMSASPRENNETWEWDGTNWTQKSPANKPSGRYDHAMAYDSIRGVVLLFGGYLYGGLYSDETWEWDGTNWVLKNPSNNPSGRSDHALAYDSVRGVVVLFGGVVVVGAGHLSDETWEY